MVWLFTGLRKNEFSRLRLGCIRWQREDVTVPWTGEVLPKDAVCLLDVPTNKTGTAFTKPGSEAFSPIGISRVGFTRCSPGVRRSVYSAVVLR